MKSKTQRYTDGLPFACTRSKKLIWKLKKLISNNDKVVFEFYKIKSIFTFCFLQYLIITLESLYTLKYGVFCSTEQNSLFFMRTMLKCQYIGRLTCLVVYDPLFHRDKISSTSTTPNLPKHLAFPRRHTTMCVKFSPGRIKGRSCPLRSGLVSSHNRLRTVPDLTLSQLSIVEIAIFTVGCRTHYKRREFGRCGKHLARCSLDCCHPFCFKC